MVSKNNTIKGLICGSLIDSYTGHYEFLLVDDVLRK